MGLIDDEEIHENCMAEVGNLNEQLIAIQNESTKTNIEKNRLEMENNQLKSQIQSMKSSISNISVKYFQF